ncbi:LPS assembly lipoprotein LptE [Paracoccus sp. (in: a-proteobacteria)]|uniref:LPS assembly lipoprotein LptE n=1 Tax=Paracoccus sp. TaxID=267 RepID=UPI0026DEDEA5|nr:LPS assembly lipoprotein LptE [Paracoccus sp. (in: a-proteobacteria)]MDO5648605.1 LPS assembly lipoprotein LptE [Paracoccus sp. (in: a-proteobacteria)]
MAMRSTGPLAQLAPRRGTPRRTVLAALALLALTGCGMTPVYGPGSPAKALFGQVRPKDASTFDEFTFNRRISERLGPEGADYALSYTLRFGAVPQGITPDEVTTRYSLNGTADFTLTGPDGAVVTRGRVSSFTSYSTTGTTIATLTAEGDARNRLAVMLADQVVMRLLAAAGA